jgi:DNA modification methylase
MIRIINADVIDGLRSLPEKSVHCVVTSPPYWGLRDYGIEGQIGLEPTPEEYLEKMVKVFREVKRVLRDDGTLWLNIGDSYANAQPRGRMEDQGDLSTGDHGELIPKRDWSCWNLKQKDLVGMCWRVAFALQSEGWYLRSDIIWAKPNPMPESVTDRPTRSHEYIFLFAKSARYFYDADAVREEQTGNAHSRGYSVSPKHGEEGSNIRNKASWQNTTREVIVPGGRNRRDVWTITTQPTPEAHFATFPESLVEPCIKAGTSERGCCSVCGAPWVRVVEKGEPLDEWKKASGADSNGEYRGQAQKDYLSAKAQIAADVKRRILEGMRERISQWQPPCTCNAEIVPCVVLDPFGGSGTVAKVARDLNRDAILIELNPAYVEIARRKLRANEQLFTEAVKVEVQP